MRSGYEWLLNLLHHCHPRVIQQYLHFHLGLICNAIYPQALYILQGIIEAVLCPFVMFLVKGIYQYVLKWEKSELEKFSVNKFNDMSNYWNFFTI